jgi:hypothetical protein
LVFPLRKIGFRSEPSQHFVKRTRHPDDVPAMQGNDRLVMAFVRIVDECNAVLPDRITDPINPVIKMNPPGIASP